MVWQIDRRDFLRASALGAFSLAGLRTAGAFDLNGKLRVAAVGTGNKGQDDLVSVAASPRVEIVAICDVDDSEPHLGWAVTKYPKADRYSDYRRLLDKPDSFDAIIVSTPDHMHAPIALVAMGLGKHVFCQKPLTHTVQEARQMRIAAERNRVVTQMGNQIQSNHAYRNAVKLVQDGAIGKVREVHSWQAGDMEWLLTDKQPTDADPVPNSLNWDAWLGVAPERPYKKKLYHPKNWRAWQDFSNGQMGDFGCHILDPVFMALGLSAPTSLEAEAPPMNNEVWTKQCKVAYVFPGTERTVGATLPLTWYDGTGHKPSREGLGLPDKYDLPGGGSVFVGEKGTMVLPHWDDAKLFPVEKFRDYKMPKLKDIDHYTSWAEACLDGGTTTSNFGYAGPLTETVLLGTISIRFPKEQLLWEAEACQFTHHSDANRRLSKEYRTGWAPPAS
jgi:predicted dehydrogenase